jgi:hypothetical protein
MVVAHSEAMKSAEIRRPLLKDNVSIESFGALRYRINWMIEYPST